MWWTNRPILKALFLDIGNLGGEVGDGHGHLARGGGSQLHLEKQRICPSVTVGFLQRSRIRFLLVRGLDFFKVHYIFCSMYCISCDTLAYLRKVFSLGLPSSMAVFSRAGAFWIRPAILTRLCDFSETAQNTFPPPSSLGPRLFPALQFQLLCCVVFLRALPPPLLLLVKVHKVLRRGRLLQERSMLMFMWKIVRRVKKRDYLIPCPAEVRMRELRRGQTGVTVGVGVPVALVVRCTGYRCTSVQVSGGVQVYLNRRMVCICHLVLIHELPPTMSPVKVHPGPDLSRKTSST